jgi:hypothetical protein
MTAELVEFRPTTLSDLDVVSRVAAAAVRLPNGHPWHLRAVDQGFEIRADHARRARSSGLGARTVRVAVGAALLNLRLAVAVFGHQPVVGWSFDGPRCYVDAVVRRGVPRDPTPVKRALFATVASGRAVRSRSSNPQSTAAVLAHARRAAEAEGVWLRGLVGPDCDRLARSLPGLARAAHLVVIGGNHDVAAVHLRAGLALQRLVLTAAMLGWRASVAAWPADLATVPNLPRAIGGGLWPQVIVALDQPPRPVR